MTDLRTAAQAVIDSYELGITTRQVYYGHLLERNIEALRQALAAPVEPVVWRDGHVKVCKKSLKDWDAKTGGTLSTIYKTPLYTTPPSVDALIAEIDGLNNRAFIKRFTRQQTME